MNFTISFLHFVFCAWEIVTVYCRRFEIIFTYFKGTSVIKTENLLSFKCHFWKKVKILMHRESEQINLII